MALHAMGHVVTVDGDMPDLGFHRDIIPQRCEEDAPGSAGWRRVTPWARPSTRSATMLRWISDVPPAMVPENERRICTAQAPS